MCFNTYHHHQPHNQQHRQLQQPHHDLVAASSVKAPKYDLSRSLHRQLARPMAVASHRPPASSHAAVGNAARRNNVAAKPLQALVRGTARCVCSVWPRPRLQPVLAETRHSRLQCIHHQAALIIVHHHECVAVVVAVATVVVETYDGIECVKVGTLWSTESDHAVVRAQPPVV